MARGRRAPARRRAQRSVHRRRHEHQAQADGRRRGQLRRRASARRPARTCYRLRRARARSTRSSWSASDGKQLLGGVLVGDAADYGTLLQMTLNGMRAAGAPGGPDPAAARRRQAPPAWASTRCPTPRRSARATTSTKGAHLRGRRDGGCTDRRRAQERAPRPAPAAAAACRWSRRSLKAELEARGVAVNNHLCEHFAVLAPGAVSPGARRTASRPSTSCSRSTAAGWAATSASRRWRRSSPRAGTSSCSKREHAPLQDTNDYFLANMQKDGTYSVVPRVPGGEITPEKLIAHRRRSRKKYGLYTKITGGQRIDLFGARVEQLPLIWQRADRRRLRVGPRLRQGAAHGEVVRRLDLVPLRRAGLGRPRDRAREPLQGPARAAQDQVRRCRAARANAPRRRARTSASSPPRRAGTSTSAATAA